MLRLLAFAMFVLSLVLIAQAVWLHSDSERLKAIGVGVLALLLVGGGVAMIASGG